MLRLKSVKSPNSHTVQATSFGLVERMAFLRELLKLHIKHLNKNYAMMMKGVEKENTLAAGLA